MDENNNARNRSPKCWHRLSKTKKITIIVVTCSIALAIIITTALLLTLLTSKAEKKVCRTSACMDASKSMRSFMDESVDPCEHFYNFACGKFVKDHQLKDEYDRADTILLNNALIRSNINQSLNEPISNNDLRPFKISKMLYKSCMDEAKVEKDSTALIKSIIEKLGGWPLVLGDSWKEDSFDWKNTIYLFSDIGIEFNQIIDISIGPNPTYTKSRTIWIGPPGVQSLFVESFFSTKSGHHEMAEDKARLQFIMEIAKFFGASGPKLDSEITMLFSLEKTYNLLSQDVADFDVGTMFTVKEFEEKYPGIPWLEFLNKIFAPNAQITANDILQVIHPSFIVGFTSAVQSTPKRELANFLVWKAVEYALPYTGGKLLELYMSQSPKKSTRTEFCLKITENTMPIATAALYIRNHFNKEIKSNVKEMVVAIRDTVEKRIKEVEWMDEVTRKAALEKVQEMELLVAHPDEFLDDKKLDSYYEDYKYDENGMYQSILNKNIFQDRFHSKRLKQPYNRTEWVSHADASTVNAYYNSLDNTIEILAAILNGEIYQVDRPKFMNFGRTGSVIGHEITHGFDSNGRKFDKFGNYKDWWQPDTEKKFLEKAQCMIDQYNAFKADTNLTVDGIKTLGENIADNGGNAAAYAAYKAWIKENGAEPGLPDLKYDTSELFWISAAQLFCSKLGKKMLKEMILTDVHSPGEFRIIGSFTNNKDFAEDFGCKVGSYMNPEKKCKIW